MIEIQNLVKRYGKNYAVNDISFKVNKGEIVGFLGPNGAGKSTTMNILTGYLSATGGSVKIAGIDVLENPIEAKKHIGFLPEHPPLYLDMTVKEYLNFVYDLKKCNLNKKKHIEEIVEVINIGEVYKRPISHLSKGYRQRVGIAQALISSPDILIFDEPTVGLDPRQIMEIRDVIKSLGKNKTIILSTHIMQEIEAVCDSVTIIAQGNIVAQNTLAEIGEDAGGKNRYIVGVLGNGEVAYNTIKAMPETVSCEVSRMEKNMSEFIVEHAPDTDIRLSLTSELAKNNLAIASLRGAKLSLEEIFIKLTASHNPIVSEEEESDDSDI